jgi:hypothetical protein
MCCLVDASLSCTQVQAKERACDLRGVGLTRFACARKTRARSISDTKRVETPQGKNTPALASFTYRRVNSDSCERNRAVSPSSTAAYASST